MRIVLKNALLALGLQLIWAIILFLATLNGWWHKPLTESENPDDFYEAAINRVATTQAGSVVLAMIEGGKIHKEYAYSIDGPVNRNTAFQVASLSKWITAWGVISLVNQNKLDLDQPVSSYLTRWQLPEGDFKNDGVTVRRLLSHTAGLTDGLGYGGFLPDTPTQSLEESLTQASDASPGASGATKVGVEPGTEWIYSGAGYTLLQLLIEEVSGQSFQSYMDENVFQPLGMINSTFEWDDTKHSNLAKFYDQDGTIQPHLRYTSLAATSLYTSLHDMEQFFHAHFEGENSEPRGRGVMKEELLDAIKSPHAYQMGAAIWGLGTMLYAGNNQNDFIIGHDGQNDPAINTAARLDPITRDGVIVLAMGSASVATEIGSDWVFWKTGNVDSLLFLSLARTAVTWFVVGALVIVAVIVIRRRRSG